jgi:hypothetical protein
LAHVVVAHPARVEVDGCDPLQHLEEDLRPGQLGDLIIEPEALERLPRGSAEAAAVLKPLM